MNFTHKNPTSATAQNKNSAWRRHTNTRGTSKWRNRNHSNNNNNNTHRNDRDNTHRNVNQFKPTLQKKTPTADVNSLVSFPKLSDKKIVQPKCSSKLAFLNKIQQQDNIKDKKKEATCDLISNLPMGWVRLSQTNPSVPTEEEIQLNEKRERFERKQNLVKGIWSSLRHIQKQRDELNEVLGSNSPYYDSYDILGPPGASEDDDDEYDCDYSSDEKTEEDEYM